MPATARTLANAVISGTLTGTVYGLMALGLSAIFGVIRLVNFAHGELMTLAMYAAVVAFQGLALDPFLTMIGAAAVFAALGYVLQRGFINRFVQPPRALPDAADDRAGDDHRQRCCCSGFGPDARNVQTSYQLDSFELGPMLLDKVRVYAAGAAVRGDGAAGRVLSPHPHRQGDPRLRRQSARRARRGPARRAPLRRDLRSGRRLRRRGRLRDGAAHRRDARGSDPAYTLLAFVIVIVGGLGSMVGALLGGVVIGVSEALAGVLIAPSAKSMVSFGLLVWSCSRGPRASWERAGDDVDRRERRAGERRRRALIAARRGHRRSPCRSSRTATSLSVATLALYLAYVGQAWNVMMGFAGQLSLGHSLYVGPRRVRGGGAVLPLRRRSLGGRLARDRRFAPRWARSSAFSPSACASPAFNSRC